MRISDYWKIRGKIYYYIEKESGGDGEKERKWERESRSRGKWREGKIRRRVEGKRERKKEIDS